MTYSEFLDLDDHELKKFIGKDLKKYLISGCKKT